VDGQTLAFACIAALYPVGLLAVSLLLTTKRPLPLGLSFYAGGFTTLFVVGTLVITVMHGAGSDSSHGARGGFRVGFGAAMLLAAWVLSHRPAKAKTEPAWKVRLRDANPLAVFFAGALLYSPSGSFLGAVTTIATTKGGWPYPLQLLIVLAIVLITVEVPLILYALRPEPTARTLRRAEGWIDLHGRQTLIILLTIIGSYLFIDGLILIA
jgi:Sap, sulfolipid-1-addressing protein